MGTIVVTIIRTVVIIVGYRVNLSGVTFLWLLLFNCSLKTTLVYNYHFPRSEMVNKDHWRHFREFRAGHVLLVIFIENV